MSKTTDFLVQELALQGGSTVGTNAGRTIKISNCDKVAVSIVVSVTAATLQGTLSIGGTNDESRAADQAIALPALTSGTNTAMPTGITYSGTTGVFTLNNPSIGTSEVVVTYASFPRYLRPSYTYASGGGVVSVQVTVSAWST